MDLCLSMCMYHGVCMYMYASVCLCGRVHAQAVCVRCAKQGVCERVCVCFLYFIFESKVPRKSWFFLLVSYKT